MRYARIAECEMAHGTMRCDVNISVRPEGSNGFGVRTELKNMKSIEAIKRAIDYETERHIDALEKGWAISWQARGWKKADKKPALNPDLWEILLSLVDKHQVHYHWVKGHADNPYNNRCDALAVAESKKFN